MKRMLKESSKIKDKDEAIEFYFRNVNPIDVEELLCEAFIPKFKNIQLFNEKTRPLMIEFAKKMHKSKLAPNTVVYEKGDHDDRFYLIASGSVKLMFHDSQEISFAKIVKGYFGEFELFRDCQRRYTVMTDEEQTVLYSISKEHFIELFVNRDRDFCNEFKEYAYEREKKFRDSLAELQKLIQRLLDEIEIERVTNNPLLKLQRIIRSQKFREMYLVNKDKFGQLNKKIQEKRFKNQKLDPKTSLPIKITKLNLRSNRDILEDEKEQAMYVGNMDKLEKFESSRYDSQMGLSQNDFSMRNKHEKDIALQNKSIHMLNNLADKKIKKKSKKRTEKQKKKKQD